jgi:broad specificity phosphatase PhoE
LQEYAKVLLTKKFKNVFLPNLLGATRTNLNTAIHMVSRLANDETSGFHSFHPIYPGESYLDLLQRVDGVVQALLLNTGTNTKLKIEAHLNLLFPTDVLVVSHQAVLRCIMAYFKGSKPGGFTASFLPLSFL